MLVPNPNAGRPIKKASGDQMTKMNLGDGSKAILVEGNFVGGNRWEIVPGQVRRRETEK